MRERIFTPLNMKSTSTSIKAFAGNTNVATPHSKIDDKVRAVSWRNIDNIAPAGSINSNVQDMALIHCDSGFPNHIGADVTIGHGAIVHGVFVGEGALIGMGAILLGESRVEAEALVAAGAVVPPRMVVPARTMVAGVPAKIVRDLNERDLEYMRSRPPHYIRLAQMYAAGKAEEGGRPLEKEAR